MVTISPSKILHQITKKNPTKLSYQVNRILEGGEWSIHLMAYAANPWQLHPHRGEAVSGQHIWKNTCTSKKWSLSHSHRLAADCQNSHSHDPCCGKKHDALSSLTCLSLCCGSCSRLRRKKKQLQFLKDDTPCLLITKDQKGVTSHDSCDPQLWFGFLLHHNCYKLLQVHSYRC